jgi:thiamine biosynthesis lipoprotein
MALHVAERTSGAFDITVQPLMELWGFNTPAPAVPDRAQIEERRRSVNWRNLAIEHGQVVRRNAATRIDLGGIAKGYAVAEAVRVLKDAGIRSALVDAGGDIYAFGRTGGRPWRVGIRNPRGEGIIGVLDLCEQSLATSGDYERCFERDGVRYHHILDPATGYPAGGVVSVTVLSSNATLADAWSTALFVLSAQRGLECAEAVPDVDALIVTSEGKRLYTSGLRDRIRAPAPPP